MGALSQKQILSYMQDSQVIFSRIIWMRNGVKPSLSKNALRMEHLIFTIAIGLTADFINEVAMTYGYDRLRFINRFLLAIL